MAILTFDSLWIYKELCSIVLSSVGAFWTKPFFTGMWKKPPVVGARSQRVLLACASQSHCSQACISTAWGDSSPVAAGTQWRSSGLASGAD